MGKYHFADGMNERSETCIDPTFHERHCKAESQGEAQAVIIGMYLGNELAPDVSLLVKRHLEHCACCSRQLESLSEIESFRAETERHLYAICPSADLVDAYVFDRAGLTASQAAAIEAHLGECPLCREEIDWLRGVGLSPALEFNRPRWQKWIRTAGSAAAVIIFALLAIALYQRARAVPAETALRSLATVKQPEQINYDELNRTSRPLPAQDTDRYRQAVSLVRHGEFRQASGMLQDLVRQYPEHSGSVFLLGYCYFKLDQPQKAYELCNRAEAILPHGYERCMSLVQLALITGHYDRAVEEITALHHNLPDNAEVTRLYDNIIRLKG